MARIVARGPINSVNVIPERPRLVIHEDRLLPLEVSINESFLRDALEIRVAAMLRDINLAHLTFPG